MANFASQIIEWYVKNKRDLPWRHTQNPYQIWLSEVILQQTQVKQGLPYYLKFIKALPTIHDFAKADEQTIINLWQGLGYYSRARNAHTSAKQVVETFNGKFPQTYDELIKLKGIGDYTASAIASFAFDQKEAVVDGNVYRVLSRYFNISEDLSNHKSKRIFKDLALSILPEKNINTYNQGIMEFGALQCTAKKPDCMFCPLTDSCGAKAVGVVNERPVKTKKVKKTQRYLTYVCFDDGKHTIMHKRLGKGIWENMYEFPVAESDTELLSLKAASSIIDININGELINTVETKHVLTHQNILARCYHLNVSTIPKGLRTKWNDLEELPFPRLIEKFLEKMKD